MKELSKHNIYHAIDLTAKQLNDALVYIDSTPVRDMLISNARAIIQELLGCDWREARRYAILYMTRDYKDIERDLSSLREKLGLDQ